MFYEILILLILASVAASLALLGTELIVALVETILRLLKKL